MNERYRELRALTNKQLEQKLEEIAKLQLVKVLENMQGGRQLPDNVFMRIMEMKVSSMIERNLSVENLSKEFTQIIMNEVIGSIH